MHNKIREDSTQRMKMPLKELKRAAPKSFALLVLLPAFFVFAYAIALLYPRQTFFRFWPCAFRRLTGWYCPACGSTRAVTALSHFRFVQSFLFNPYPILVLLLLVAIWLYACYCVLIKRADRRFPRIFLWFYIILGIGLVYCVLRNTPLFDTVPVGAPGTLLRQIAALRLLPPFS